MKTSVIVQNLQCDGCAKTITSKLSEMNGLSDVDVDTETTTVHFTCENIDDAILVKDKLKALGYPSIEYKNSVSAKARSFLSCASGKMSKE
ncbi:MAG: heavy-metal-associated domain-containing protein [Eudoraea sp.]|uniref:heavy-metal-associated domain-containing protein n=1 Tax=Eudoraea sp. TaxID=1979955 RepID=UPI003C727876